LLDAGDVDVVVPMPVLREVSPDPADPADPIVQAIGGARWSVAPMSPVPGTLNGWKLDRGEESVLAVALQNPAAR
jgi:hypothetical protein